MSNTEKEVIVPSDPVSREKIKKALQLIGDEWAIIDGHKAVIKETIDTVAELERYKHGFVSDIEQEFAPPGLNADIIRFISEKKGEPGWMLDWRLAAFERWQAMKRT